ncbi:HAD family acid phosphatase [Pseudomonas aeruginosa]|nr:HAD family acid phosphatase [Pseudomonas aeruginosa]
MPAATPASNLLTAAVAWRQAAAEYRALYYQGFNVARDRLDRALAARQPGARKPAIVSDLDDTLLGSNSYWSFLLSQDKEFFDDAVWDRWVAANGPSLTPGALEFLEYARSRGVEIFYVSSRDQGEKTLEYALGNMRALRMPFADAEHVTILRDSSNKEPAQKAIAAQYDVLLMLGDNLNDFQRRYYVDDVMQRNRLLDEDHKAFGEKYVIFPNPTDGHWMKAIFGESEPADTPTNRARFALRRARAPGWAATETLHCAPGKVRRQSSAAHSAQT